MQRVLLIGTCISFFIDSLPFFVHSFKPIYLAAVKVKVLIDISKPLKRWLRLKLDNFTEIVMVSLKYERLPEFCYVCGRIGHVSKECSDEEAKIEALNGVSTKFGSWMRASILERKKPRFE